MPALNLEAPAYLMLNLILLLLPYFGLKQSQKKAILEYFGALTFNAKKLCIVRIKTLRSLGV